MLRTHVSISALHGLQLFLRSFKSFFKGSPRNGACNWNEMLKKHRRHWRSFFFLLPSLTLSLRKKKCFVEFNEPNFVIGSRKRRKFFFGKTEKKKNSPRNGKVCSRTIQREYKSLFSRASFLSFTEFGNRQDIRANNRWNNSTNNSLGFRYQKENLPQSLSIFIKSISLAKRFLNCRSIQIRNRVAMTKGRMCYNRVRVLTHMITTATWGAHNHVASRNCDKVTNFPRNLSIQGASRTV